MDFKSPSTNFIWYVMTFEFLHHLRNYVNIASLGIWDILNAWRESVFQNFAKTYVSFRINFSKNCERSIALSLMTIGNDNIIVIRWTVLKTLPFLLLRNSSLFRDRSWRINWFVEIFSSITSRVALYVCGPVLPIHWISDIG